MVVAHMGHPWIYETVVVMRRHANIYADTSAIPSRPTVLANALSAAKEYGVLNKVLFGSDSPMVAAERAVESLHKVVARMQQVAYTPITPLSDQTVTLTGHDLSIDQLVSMRIHGID